MVLETESTKIFLEHISFRYLEYDLGQLGADYPLYSISVFFKLGYN